VNISFSRKNLLHWVRLGRCGMDSSGSGCGPVAGSYENGNDPSYSI